MATRSGGSGVGGGRAGGGGGGNGGGRRAPDGDEEEEEEEAAAAIELFKQQEEIEARAWAQRDGEVATGEGDTESEVILADSATRSSSSARMTATMSLPFWPSVRTQRPPVSSASSYI
jgi:hypothetical protein